MFWQGLSYIVLSCEKKKHDLTSVKSKPSEVISDYFRDPKKNDTVTVTVMYSYVVIVVSGYWAFVTR